MILLLRKVNHFYISVFTHKESLTAEFNPSVSSENTHTLTQEWWAAAAHQVGEQLKGLKGTKALDVETNKLSGPSPLL